MTEIANIKEGSLGSEPLGSGGDKVAARATTIPPKWSRASGMATVLVANVSPPCLDQTLQEATCSPLSHAHHYHGRFALTASGRRSKGSYVPSESEDIDLK
jgi:hypothetical protein